MKKIFTTLLFSISLVWMCQSQAVFVQDFENGIEPMKLYDVDGLTAHGNVAFWADAWTVANPAFGNESNVAVSNSWYAPAGVADDWMVTPKVMIQDGAIVRWESKAQDASFRDGYQLLLSTATDAVEDFTTVVFEIAAEESDWLTRTVDMSAYAGQEVYLAWRNNSSDKFLLLVDNIFVGVPVPNDIRIVKGEANINRGTALEGMRNLSISFTNLGNNDVNSISASYSLNGGDVMSTDLDGLVIPPGESYTFDHPDAMNFEPGDMQNLVFSIDLVNGTVDPDQALATIENFKVFPPIPDFDLVTSKGENIRLYDILTTPQVVVLDFFASWCGPCASSTPALNQFYVDNGNGDENLMVLGLDIESSDNDNVVNNLGWGATYPKFSYSETMEDFWTHFDVNHGLGESSIPFFIMICPNPDDPGHSEIIHSEIGFVSGMFNSDFQPIFDDCSAGLSTSVEEISALTESKIYPNPTTDVLNIEFGLETTSDIQIQVIDQLGRMVKDLGIQTYLDGNNKLQFETSDFDNGIYYVRLNKASEISTFKFTVAH